VVIIAVLLLASLLQGPDNLAAREKELRAAVAQAHAASAHNIEFAQALAVLGIFYQDIGKLSEAETNLRKSVNVAKEITGPEDLALAPLITHLASLYVETGRAADANRLHLEIWIDRLTLVDPESKYLPSILETLGGLYALQGRLTSAENLYRRDFELLSQRRGEVSVAMASAVNNFGFVQLRLRRYNEAAEHFSRALRLWVQLSGSDGLPVALSRLGLAEAYLELGRYDDSVALLRQVLPVFERRCGPDSLRTADVLSQYARLLRRQKRTDEAKTFEVRAPRIRHESAADVPSGQVIDVWSPH
jgi:tetratricopeptide (TPR) repeat protein